MQTNPVHQKISAALEAAMLPYRTSVEFDISNCSASILVGTNEGGRLVRLDGYPTIALENGRRLASIAAQMKAYAKDRQRKESKYRMGSISPLPARCKALSAVEGNTAVGGSAPDSNA